MSGDGVEDVTIPSVFMRHEQALLLLQTWKEMRGDVLVRLAPSIEGEGGESGQKEGEEFQKGAGDGVVQGDGVPDMPGIRKYQQEMLEGIDQSSLSEEVRGVVARELRRVRERNAGLEDAAAGGGGGGGVEERDSTEAPPHSSPSDGG